jgi:hypothetical protein
MMAEMERLAAKEKLEMDVEKASKGIEVFSVEDESWTEVEKMDGSEGDNAASAALKKAEEKASAMDVDESKESQTKEAKQDKKRKAPFSHEAHDSSLPSDHDSTQKAVKFLQSLCELSQLKADSGVRHVPRYPTHYSA